MRSIRLLIVDDEVVDRAYYQRMLRQSVNIPYEVIEAVSGQEALEYLKDHEVDCILLDYQLPDINGLELLTKIKKMSGKFVPVIMLTGRGDEEVAVNAMKEGAEDYFIKNKIEPHVLMKTIQAVIRNSQLKKTIYEQKKQLKYYAYYDNLTGFVNRHTFDEIAKHALIEAKRLHHELAILLIDLDNFTSVNDSLGFLAGNELLIETAKRIKNVLPKEVIVARLGDDEFAVLLTGLDIDIYAATIARKIVEEINLPYQLSIDKAHIGASIGIAYYPGSSESLNELFKNANSALSLAKSTNRGSFKFYSEELNKIFKTDLELEKALNDAMVTSQEFYLLYQPRFECLSKKLVGIEVILRWNHPELGLLVPCQFMSIADKAGLLIPLAKWMIEQLVEELIKISKESLKKLSISIDLNLSPFQLSNYQVADAIKNLIEKTALPARNIELEINETTLTKYLQTDSVFEKLHGISIQPKIHTFEIASTLNELMKLPITSLRIDKTFVQELEKRKYSIALVKSILQLARELELNVVAEGVDNETQYNALLMHGCSQVQGDFFSKPLTIDELIKMCNFQGD